MSQAPHCLGTKKSRSAALKIHSLRTHAFTTVHARLCARDRIRELTSRRRLLLSVKWIVEDINRLLRGWAAYFRYGNSARHFDKIMGYARTRLAIVIGKRHRRSRAFAGR